MFRRDVGVCDRFVFVDLRYPEIRGAIAHIEALQQIAVVDHAMVNVTDASNESQSMMNISCLIPMMIVLQT